MFSLQPVILFSFVVLALAKPLDVPVVVPRQDGPLSPNQTVCGEIIVAAQNGFTLFYADVVFDCLQSVPFNDAVATRFINYYNITLQFQSTLAFLKDPPPDYQQPPVDVLQVLRQIQSNITAGNYKNQYGFEADVQLLLHRMHDSHVTLNAGIMDAFSFLSPYGLVSVSVDGKQLPEIYLSRDLLLSQVEGWKASPVAQINGQDVISYLTRFAELNSNGNLEPHADWNSLMDSPAMWISGDLSDFQSAIFYPGNSLNYTFKNDSEVLETYWLSMYNELENTGPLATAGDFYNFFVLGRRPASYDPKHPWWPTLPTDDSSSNNSSEDSTLIDPFSSLCFRDHSSIENWCNESFGAYPGDPVVAQPDLAITKGGVITGYIYDDISTGVLSIPSFYQYDRNIEQFDLTIQYLIGNATTKNVSRIVVDLQANSGGSVFLAYNTFKHFFYHMEPYGASRIRSHEFANILGDTFSKWWKELERDFDGNEELNGVNYNYTAAEEWVVPNRIDAATGNNFSSWSDYGGRVLDHGDTFSSAQRYNLSDEVFDAAAFGGWIPFGYGIATAKSPIPQLWASKDIVILTDGICGSACALFVEFMTQMGVRTVAVGGRPASGPMQAVSGSRGARAYQASELDSDFAFVAETIKNSTAAALLPNRSDTGMWVTSASINIRDQIRENDVMPLQFKYEAADCRIYYTLANIFNMSRLWRDAATAAWDDSSLCVAGSTGFPSAHNTSSTKAPPKRTAQVPILDLDFPNSVGPAGNDSVGYAADLMDNGELYGSQIYSCTSHGECDSGVCTETLLMCSRTLKPVYACLPKCRSNGGGCPSNSECDYDIRASTKLNSVDQRHAVMSQPFYLGHCRPMRPSADLGCPK